MHKMLDYEIGNWGFDTQQKRVFTAYLTDIHRIHVIQALKTECEERENWSYQQRSRHIAWPILLRSVIKLIYRLSKY